MGIKTNITEMFGIKHPIIAAPMGPFYTKELTVAVSEAGGLGVLSHTNLFGKNSLEVMKSNMEYVVEHTDKPFGFNIRTSRLQLDAPGLCRGISRFIMDNPKIKEQCIYAVTSAGSPKILPKAKTYQKLKESGSNIKHFHVAPALWLLINVWIMVLMVWLLLVGRVEVIKVMKKSVPWSYCNKLQKNIQKPQ